jgi:hypothetical protein
MPSGEVMRMADYFFTPPLLLVPHTSIHTLHEAAEYVLNHTEVRRPQARLGVLRAILTACTPDQQRIAAKGFRSWAETEGLLLGEK